MNVCVHMIEFYVLLYLYRIRISCNADRAEDEMAYGYHKVMEV